MMSAMNNKDCELDRGPDAIEGEPRPEPPRVSGEDAAVGDNSCVETGGGGRGASSDMIGSEEAKVSQGDVVDSSCLVVNCDGDKGMSSESLRSEGIRVSTEPHNRAQETESDVRVSDGGDGVVENRRSEEIRAAEVNYEGIDKENDSRGCEIKNENVISRESENKFSERNGRTEHSREGIEADTLNSREKGLVGVTQRVSDHRFDIWNGGMDGLSSKVGKGRVEMGKSSVSQYDSMLSMFDVFAANGKVKAMGPGQSNALGYGFEIGDMVWGKVKSHPCWPGHLYNEAFASPSVRRTKREGHVLVAFFGDSSYGWFELAELLPFDCNFAEKSRQTNSRNFVKAVEEAVDEVSRRCALGLACRCRNPYNFRPTDVQGYFFVDVVDYEPGTIYSVSQIRKARDAFQPTRTLAFVKQLALTPNVNDHPSIDFIKNKATVFAYRKAVFEEFDETYAQAFGVQPVRPSREPAEAVAQLFKEPSRAPLSGPLVFPETLSKRKTSANKVKDRAKKDRYLFKRRDDRNELLTHQINLGQASPSTLPAYIEGSSPLAAGDYVLQKRTPAVSVKPKHERTGSFSVGAASSSDVTGKTPVVFKEKSAVAGTAGSSMNLSKVDSPANHVANSAGQITDKEKSFLVEGIGNQLEMIERVGSDAAAGSAYVHPSSLSGKGAVLGVVDNKPQNFEPESEVTVNFKNDPHSTTKTKLLDVFQRPSSLPNTVQGQKRVQDGGQVAKKAKVLKRSATGELSAEKSAFGEKKKKKRKKELGKEMSSDDRQKLVAARKSGALPGKVMEKPVQGSGNQREEFYVDLDLQKKVDATSSSTLSVPVVTQPMVGSGNIELELPQLLSDLHSLALNPFHGLERNSPATIHHVFLRFRSLVYQKSLSLFPTAESEPNEVSAVKHPSGTAVSDNRQGESFRELPAPKSSKPPVRFDDPTKGGKKRSPSDRQEEMAAKRLKKINDLKTLASEKKTSQKTQEAQRDAKETVAPTPPRQVKVDFTKKTEPLAKAPEPTMLVMKFPPGTNLPSGSELKARLARFGQLDHSGTRVFWQSSTCRVVFVRKPDAQAAYKYLMGGNFLFGNVSVRCHLREMGVPAQEPESGKVRTEDTSVETAALLRESAADQRVAAVAAQRQPAVQLKSCLKKSGGDETTAGGGNGRGTTRVKFMLGGEESSRSEQTMVSNKNNFNNNASIADGGASSSSSSSSLAMEFNSKNTQKVIPPPPLPLSSIHPLSSGIASTSNLHYTEPRNSGNYSIIDPLSSTNIDIAPQMLSLLTRCNDVVANVKSFLGYVPYHPL